MDDGVNGGVGDEVNGGADHEANDGWYTKPWEEFPGGGPGSRSEPPEEARRRGTELPRTFLAAYAAVDPGQVGLPRLGPGQGTDTGTGSGGGPAGGAPVTRAEPAFDPALLHFSLAFRVSDPRFGDPALADRWRTARRAALDAVLVAIERGGWADSLVLRGSALLSGWLGRDAREPGDLDFVVTPVDWRIDDARTEPMLLGIAADAQRVAGERPGGPVILADRADSEYIWAYERVPGRRMVLPWSVPGSRGLPELPGGLVQLDFVFGEELPERPRRTRVALSAGSPGALLRAASPEVSFAWKLVWLLCDMHPQGKDLYDAVLLGERHRPPYEVIQETYRVSHDSVHPITFDQVVEATEGPGWEHFRREYPHLARDQAHYAERLLAVLRPVFADR